MNKIQELAKFSKQQRLDLEHYILNAMMRPAVARLLKRARAGAKEIVLSKEEAETILNTLFGIRKFVMDLPQENMTKAQQVLKLFDDEGTLSTLGKAPNPALGVVTKYYKMTSKSKKKKKKEEEDE
jgi:hypothetical protein